MVDSFGQVDQGRLSPSLHIETDQQDVDMTIDGPADSVFPSSASRSKKRVMSRSQPRPIHTPTSPLMPAIPNDALPTAPASPPTPAPSPTPMARAPDWSTASEYEDSNIRDIRAQWRHMANDEQQRLLSELLNMCTNNQLIWVHDFVSPRLKKDPFTTLPNELCLKILTFIDDPKSLARSSQVSRRWREMVSDDMAWKSLCEKHAYRRLSNETDSPTGFGNRTPTPSGSPTYASVLRFGALARNPSYPPGPSNSAPDLTTASLEKAMSPGFAPAKRRPKALTYRSHFKQRYMVETAWRNGGKCDSRQITPDQGVVTSLHLTDKYIVVALDNAKIHVFDIEGGHQKTLLGHVMGVWAMVPWGDLLVSGGCDRDVRVWDMATGKSECTLTGHTSTVRCLKMSDWTTAISGSRDTTLRIWDVRKKYCKHVLVGHQASVRCLEIHGDIVVSGSYDTTARIWSISEGKCLQTLSGHFSQIYAIAFDGKRIATGSLDTSVRVWDPTNGSCIRILQGHTSLVGQLQMRGDVLVTGGSDGSVRVWNLNTHEAIHRLAAHDNSVTSLQFDETRIVSGGSDGRVKVWDLKTGRQIRDLSSPAEAVWRVVFEEEKAVIMANRAGKTIMEVWSFAPPDDQVESARSASPVSTPEKATPAFWIKPEDNETLVPPPKPTLAAQHAASFGNEPSAAATSSTAQPARDESGDVTMSEEAGVEADPGS